ncbi:MAG: tetratricopeptide repeat protein [Candidatus Marinimicrobia bacterium]|nr:tetratricopeptide repeat protein [Candidatus Neomarinimicrobiota bacterium]
MNNKIAFLAGSLLLAALGCESQEFVSAKMYIQQDDLESAEEYFLLAMDVETEQRNAVVPFLLARDVYAKQRRYEDMNRMLDEALRRNPAQRLDNFAMDELVLNLRRMEWSAAYKQAAALYNAVIAETGGAPPNDLQREQLIKAKDHFKTAILIWPEEPSTFANLVYCYRHLGDTESERAAIATALEKDPENGVILLLAGEQAWKLDERERALGLYRRALEAMPDNIDAMQRLTTAYLELGDRESALETLELTQRHAPKDPDVYYNIGTVYANIGNDAVQRGQSLYRDAVGMEEIPVHKLVEAEEDFKQAQRAFSESLYFMDNTLALNPDDEAATRAINEIQKMKKILITLQRSTEELIKQRE